MIFSTLAWFDNVRRVEQIAVLISAHTFFISARFNCLIDFQVSCHFSKSLFPVHVARSQGLFSLRFTAVAVVDCLSKALPVEACSWPGTRLFRLQRNDATTVSTIPR